MHDPDAMKVFPYVRYHARNDGRTRSEHGDLDGMIFRKDDPFLRTHTPPWEFNCRCRLEEITEKEAGKTPSLIQAMTPADQVKVESSSGFRFDPEHAFENFDCGSIHDPEGRANVIDEMSRRFPDVTQKIYRSNATGYLEGKAAELQRRVPEELPRKIFPAEPKEILTGKLKEYSIQQARKAVPPEAMKRSDDAAARLGKEGMRPFMHYSSRPEDSENQIVRLASFKNGDIDWGSVKASPKRIKDVKDLQKQLENMPTFHGTLYRGCTFDSEENAKIFLNAIFNTPENLKGFISTTPDPVVAHHYVNDGRLKVIIVIPNSQNAVYFGPHSTHPEDEEALFSYKFYLKGLKKYEKDGIMYIMAEEHVRK